jgi:Lrp/AsnC family transcriptional regulator, leucine-responsive regulatory protein
MTNYSMTSLDWKILEKLQQDGRTSVSELAKSLSRSRSNITEHIEQLLSHGVLKQFSITIDPEKLGFGVSAFVRLEASSKQHRQIINHVSELPEVAECHVMTGSELLVMRVICKDMPHLRSLVDSLTQFGATQTDVIFATVKSEIKIDEKLQQSLDTDL